MKLPEKIESIHEMMKMKKTAGAALSLLPDLLKALQEASATKKYYAQLENQAYEADRRWSDCHKEVYGWFLDKMDLLKSSKWATYPKVQERIDRAENVLQFKCNTLAINFFNEALEIVKGVASSIAEFGQDTIFDGWAKIQPIRVPSAGAEPGFDLTKVGEGVFELTKKKQTALSNKLGHGIAYWEVEKIEKLKDEEADKLTAYLCRGYISHYVFPQCFEAVFGIIHEEEKEQEYQEWAEKIESDPVALFRLLKCLSGYSTRSPLQISYDEVPRTIEDTISQLRSARDGLYLSSFARYNPEVFFQSQEDVFKLINSFLEDVLLHSTECASNGNGYQKVVSRKPLDDHRTRDKKEADKLIKELWRVNSHFSQSSILFGLQFAISLGVVALEEDYKESTYKTWIRQADLPKKERPRRSRRRVKQHTEQITHFIKEKGVHKSKS